MITYLILFINILLNIYAIAIICLIIGMARLYSKHNITQPFVSVLVAARNEEQNIAICLDNLLLQDYPADNYEVIVANDGSNDNTMKILLEYAKKDTRIIPLNITEEYNGLKGKKNALQQAMEKSNGEIVFLTDADCQVSPLWISEMIKHFTPKIGLVAGYVEYPIKTFRDKLLALERLSIGVMAAGSIGIGYPVVCWGANLAYRRSAFEEAGGFLAIKHSISGDDELLMQNINTNTNWKIDFCTSPKGFVKADFPQIASDLAQQRSRHLSASLHYAPPLIVLGIVGYLLNLSLFLFVPISLFYAPLCVIWSILLSKSLLDFIAIFLGARLFKAYNLLWYFPLVELLYIVYVVIIGLRGALGIFDWKGRSTREIKN